MSTQRDPDTILGAWLDEGPLELPDHTRRAILVALPTTTQRGGGFPGARWLHDGGAFARAAIAVAIAIVLVASGAFLLANRPSESIGGPTPSASPPPTTTPSPTPVDTTSWVTVTSKRFGVSYEIPPSWQVTYSSAPWLYGGTSVILDMGIDYAHPPDRSVTFGVTSQRVPAGVTDSTWWNTYLALKFTGACGPDSQASFTPITVDGLAAVEWDGLEGCSYAAVVVFDGGRAYDLRMIRGGWTPIDRGLIAAWLASIRLDPAHVDDSPAPS